MSIAELLTGKDGHFKGHIVSAVRLRNDGCGLKSVFSVADCPELAGQIYVELLVEFQGAEEIIAYALHWYERMENGVEKDMEHSYRNRELILLMLTDTAGGLNTVN